MIDNQQWLDQAQEAPLEPERKIIDPHHHLWEAGAGRLPYSLDDLWRDTGAGHLIVKTVFIECNSNYRTTGPEHLRAVGETEYVVKHAKRSIDETGKATISGIVAFADLTSPHLDEILDAHEAAAGSLLKGIRHAGAHDPDKKALSILNAQPEDLFQQDVFRKGVTRLGERGLSYDSWHYHHQNGDFFDLVESCPNTTFILDHFGTPLGVGRFKNKKDELFPYWQEDMTKLASLPNLYAKLGGLAMRDNGFYFHKQDKPPSSDLIVERQGKYYRHMIETFSAARSMFESNFPVDRLSMSYGVYWNVAKKIASDLSEAEKDQLFYGTAAKVYRLE